MDPITRTDSDQHRPGGYYTLTEIRSMSNADLISRFQIVQIDGSSKRTPTLINLTMEMDRRGL